MARKFVYDNREYPDPDPSMTVDQVRNTMATFFPELANAAVKERQQGEDTVYEFEKRLGTKG
ncbi:MAG: PRTRC system protein C [Chloroflexota bacterium]|nr:PRTRC system protein C [Chloroflexota bacterium]